MHPWWPHTPAAPSPKRGDQPRRYDPRQHVQTEQDIATKLVSTDVTLLIEPTTVYRHQGHDRVTAVKQAQAEPGSLAQSLRKLTQDGGEAHNTSIIYNDQNERGVPDNMGWTDLIAATAAILTIIDFLSRKLPSNKEEETNPTQQVAGDTEVHPEGTDRWRETYPDRVANYRSAGAYLPEWDLIGRVIFARGRQVLAEMEHVPQTVQNAMTALLATGGIAPGEDNAIEITDGRYHYRLQIEKDPSKGSQIFAFLQRPIKT